MVESSVDGCHFVNMPNRSSKPKRPRDTNQLAKRIVDISTGEAEDDNPEEDKDPAAVALGRRGGKMGGKARASKLTPEECSKMASIAATARWKKKKN